MKRFGYLVILIAVFLVIVAYFFIPTRMELVSTPPIDFLDMERKAAIKGLYRLLTRITHLYLEITPAIGGVIVHFPGHFPEDHLPQIRRTEQSFVIVAQARLGSLGIRAHVAGKQVQKQIDVSSLVNKHESVEQCGQF